MHGVQVVRGAGRAWGMACVVRRASCMPCVVHVVHVAQSVTGVGRGPCTMRHAPATAWCLPPTARRPPPAGASHKPQRLPSDVDGPFCPAGESNRVAHAAMFSCHAGHASHASHARTLRRTPRVGTHHPAATAISASAHRQVAFAILTPPHAAAALLRPPPLSLCYSVRDDPAASTRKRPRSRTARRTARPRRCCCCCCCCRCVQPASGRLAAPPTAARPDSSPPPPLPLLFSSSSFLPLTHSHPPPRCHSSASARSSR